MDLGSIGLSCLADSSVRALLLAAAALGMLWLGRVRSASLRHAVWTVTLGAMLLLPCVLPLAPDLPIRVLPNWGAEPRAQVTLIGNPDIISPGTLPAEGVQSWYSQMSWQQVALGVYGIGLLLMLGRLLLSWVLVRRLARSCVPVRDPAAIALLARYASDGPPGLLEGPGISVPVTAGALNPRILLPSGWREWDDHKLEASLIHELAHVRRRDPLVALMAAFNKCVFWFHPLAWWLERKLALLAEQAADDSAILAVADRRRYASALLDMASAAGSGPGRLRWGAVPMARPSELRRRIDRLLDESVTRSPRVSKGRWLALSACSAVVLCAVAAVRVEAVPTPAQAELPPSYQKWLDEDVAYLISDAQRSAFLQLTTDEEREAFIEQFWLKRDPTPGTSRNEFKEEYYRRIAYANERFAWNQPGWRSDRGRAYITYGPPDEIEAHPGGYRNSAPWEIWRYRWIDKVGKNVELTFYDPMRTGEYRLLP